jgi:hypothetical protein
VAGLLPLTRHAVRRWRCARAVRSGCSHLKRSSEKRACVSRPRLFRAAQVFQTPGEDEPLNAGTANRPEVLAETLLQRRRVLTRAALELAIMSSISHPNVVQVRDRAGQCGPRGVRDCGMGGEGSR